MAFMGMLNFKAIVTPDVAWKSGRNKKKGVQNSAKVTGDWRKLH
jgi:hypothetical protein